MSISTYAELVSAVQSAIARTDIPDSVYSLAVQELNTRLRLRLMETQTTLTASGGTVDLPADFLQIRALWLEDSPRSVLTQNSVWSDYHSTPSRPATFTISGGKIYLIPPPDTTYTLGIRYVSNMAEFSANADTNNILAAHSALFLYGTLKHAAIWAQDTDLAMVYDQAYRTELQRVEKADIASRFPGPLRARATVA